MGERRDRLWHRFWMPVIVLDRPGALRRLGVATDLERLAYTLQNAAEAIDVSYPTMRRKVRNGEIATFRVGSRRLVTLHELKRFIASRIAEAEQTNEGAS